MSKSRVLLLTVAAVCGPAATAQVFVTDLQGVQLTSLSFTAAPGTPPPAQKFKVINGLGTPQAITITALSGRSSWLSVSPSSVTLAPNCLLPNCPVDPSALITVNVNAASLAVGAYSGSIVIQGQQKTLTLTVSLQVQGFTLQLPPNLTFTVGSGNTNQQAFTLTNNTGSPITLSVVTADPRLKAVFTLTTVPPNGTTTLNLAFDSTGLPAGLYVESFTVSSSDGTMQTYSASFQVIVRIVASPAAITITVNAGQKTQGTPIVIVVMGGAANVQATTTGPGLTLVNIGPNTYMPMVDATNLTTKQNDTVMFTCTGGTTCDSDSAVVAVTIIVTSVAVSKVIPQVADGGGWQTTIVVVNRGSAQATASLSFFMDVTSAGSPPTGLTTPWAPQIADNVNYGQIQLAPHSALWMHTLGTAPFAQGYAILNGDPNMEAFAIFKLQVPGRQDQEGTATASVPNSTVVVPFDNAENNVTAVGLANPGLVSQTINVTFLTTSGMSSSGSLVIPAGGHVTFTSAAQFPQLAGVRGVATFSSSGGSFNALALRFNSTNAFSTVPVFPGTGGGGGTVILSQIADGGGWTTTIVLVNSGASAGNAQLSFQQDLIGGNSAPWSPSLNGQVISSASIPAGGAIFLETSGTAAFTQGYATVTADPGIQSFAIFKLRVVGRQDQEGTALASSASLEVLVPFDNTGGNNSAAALVNTGQSQTFQAQVQGTLAAIAVPTGAHDPFALNTQIPSTTGVLGLADFTSTTSLFSMLALRFNSTGAFTSIPVFPAAQ
jgi:hypothetical protein